MFQASVLFSNGEEIRVFEVASKREFEVISREKHIEALDFDPTMEMVFWVDSKERKVKRSYMPNALGGEVKTGYAQDLTVKGNACTIS